MRLAAGLSGHEVQPAPSGKGRGRLTRQAPPLEPRDFLEAHGPDAISLRSSPAESLGGGHRAKVTARITERDSRGRHPPSGGLGSGRRKPTALPPARRLRPVRRGPPWSRAPVPGRALALLALPPGWAPSAVPRLQASEAGRGAGPWTVSAALHGGAACRPFDQPPVSSASARSNQPMVQARCSSP